MRTTTTVIIGAGQAGLAMSRCLTERSIDHVLLERGDVAHSWSTGRWDSLRLLTPNWQTRLPGHRYTGPDPDGYMTMPQLIGYLRGYAAAIEAPVQTNTEVTSVRASDGGFVVTTTDGAWRARTVVLANGACGVPHVPAVAADLPTAVRSMTAADYKRPDQLEHGGVLIAGASASGVQLADEIQRSGRPVTLAVGSHARAPRTYRGLDILWWMDAAGILDQGYDDVDDVNRVRNLPSLQLAGSTTHATVDLNTLQAGGARIVGRLAGVRDGTALLSGSLRNQCTLADLKLGRMLDQIDEWATAEGLDDEVDAPSRPEPTYVEPSPPLTLPLGTGDIRTVIWATGYRPDFTWLEVPVLDPKGRIQHEGGVTPVPGLYVMGLKFLRRRKSMFIDGVGDDARDLSAHLAGHLDRELVAPAR